MIFWENTGIYSFLRRYVDACIRRSFSGLKIEGKGNIPSDGLVIFTPNHCCTMTDALVTLCGSDHKPVLYGARADIFRKPFFAAILHFMRIVPMGRKRDGAEAVSKNEATFAEVVETMGHGIPFCIFCEGTHYVGREVHPLRKGIVRITELALQSTEKPVYIVPTGISYDYFYRFMNKAALRYGEAVKCSESLISDPDAFLEMLRSRIQMLVDTSEPSRRRDRRLLRSILAVLSLPLFVLTTILASPVLLLSLFFVLRLKDKAWLNTVRFGCSLLLFVFWPFQSLFYLLLNFYNDLIDDLK